MTLANTAANDTLPQITRSDNALTTSAQSPSPSANSVTATLKAATSNELMGQSSCQYISLVSFF